MFHLSSSPRSKLRWVETFMRWFCATTRAPEIVSYLNQQQLGQAALVLERIEHRDRPASEDLPQNAIGWAVDKVRTAAPLAALVKGLLHNVALFDNLEEA